jgi:hypothetical protein
MSSDDESGSGGMSEFDPDGEPDVSPTKSDGPSTTKPASKRGRPRKNTAPMTPVTPNNSSNRQSSKSTSGPVPQSPIGGGSSQSPTAAVQAPGYLMPTMGPGGIPIMVPAGTSMNANERNHLYTLLRQIPMGFARVRSPLI